MGKMNVEHWGGRKVQAQRKVRKEGKGARRRVDKNFIWKSYMETYDLAIQAKY